MTGEELIQTVTEYVNADRDKEIRRLEACVEKLKKDHDACHAELVHCRAALLHFRRAK